MKSIVIHNFFNDFFDEYLKPCLVKLAEVVVNGDVYEIDNQDFDLAEVVIVFSDMTIDSDILLSKNLSKKKKKPCVVISKRNQNWEQEISNFINKLLPPPSFDTVKFVHDYIPVPIPEKDPIDELPKLKETINQLQNDLDQKNTEFLEQKGYASLFENENEKVSKELKSRDRYVTELTERISELEIAKQKIEKERGICASGIVRRDETIRSLTEQTEQFKNFKIDYDNLCQEISAIKLLNKDGIISDSEALERLFLISDSNG